ncbi:hypothetical protein ABFS83_07G064800 [Erythranthe nasuta]
MFDAENREMMVEQSSSGYHPYPSPLATYDNVVASSQIFMDTLKKLHLSMGTKFMNPIVGGRDLDLHRLFVEVTSRGGITKVLKDRRWREVTAVFNFPSSATNASFILRKYYVSLLYHYEQIYFFNAKCWTRSPTDAIATVTAPPNDYVAQQINTASPQPNANTSNSIPKESSSSGTRVCGVIDGKFDGGYLITVKIGTEEFKGVLYQIPENENRQGEESIKPSMNNNYASSSPSPLQLGQQPRRKRRKKCEIRKRDPAHPKPNRSGYNFFFAEQHARLKPLYHGKDREISRIIGESWNKLQEPDRSVYQEKALKDKERYKMEMEGYRERLRIGQTIPCVGPVGPTQQQRPPQVPIHLTDLNIINIQSEGGGGPASAAYMEENETSSDESGGDKEDYDNNFGEYSNELKNVNIEVMGDEAFDLQTRQPNESIDINDDPALGDSNRDGVSATIEEKVERMPSNVDELSVPNL